MHVSQSISPGPAENIPLLLLEELSHRVINEYSQAIASIRLIAARISCEEAKGALTMAVSRLCDYAAAHRALQVPVASLEVDLSNYLEQLCDALRAAMLDERGIMLSLTADKVPLERERCWRVALVVAELITNSVRHGRTGGGGVIVIRLEQLGDRAVCRVVDNGGSSTAPAVSRGSSVVRRLAQDIGGDVRWVFGHHGTRAEMSFPINNETNGELS